jgi:spore germination protein (amino acid permease)
MFVVLVMTHTPALRIIPISTAAVAKQAAWLAPVMPFILLLPVIFALKSIYKKHQDKSFTEILEAVFGRLPGKIVTLMYLLFMILLLAVNTRSTAEQLVLSIYTTVTPPLLSFVMLAVIAFSVYKGGLTVIFRMGEVILPVLVVSFVLLCALTGSDFKLSRITPISYLDALPVLKSSFVVSGVEGHLPMIFLLSNFINNKEKIGKYCTVTALMYLLLIIILNIAVIGTLGAETTANAPLPFFTAVKLISIFESIERIEPIVVVLWMFSDFILISVLLLSLLNMYKSLFRLSRTRNLIVISLIIVYFLATMLGTNMFEVQRFLEVFLTPMMIFWGYALPMIVYFVGRARKLI